MGLTITHEDWTGGAYPIFMGSIAAFAA